MEFVLEISTELVRESQVEHSLSNFLHFSSIFCFVYVEGIPSDLPTATAVHTNPHTLRLPHFIFL